MVIIAHRMVLKTNVALAAAVGEFIYGYSISNHCHCGEARARATFAWFGSAQCSTAFRLTRSGQISLPGPDIWCNVPDGIDDILHSLVKYEAARLECRVHDIFPKHSVPPEDIFCMPNKLQPSFS